MARLATPLDASVKPLFYFDPSAGADFNKTNATSGKYSKRLDLGGGALYAYCPDGDGSAPSPVANGIGGLTAIQYNGSSGYDIAEPKIKGTQLTFACVIQTVNQGNYCRLYSLGQILGGNADWNTVTGTDLEHVNNQNYIQLQRNQVLSGNCAFVDNKPFVVIGAYDGTNGYLWRNQNLIGTFASSGNFDVSSANFGQSNTRGNGGTYRHGGNALWDTFLSADDRDLVAGALMWKWDGGSPGPCVNDAPASFRYKNAAPQIGAVVAAVRRRQMRVIAS